MGECPKMVIFNFVVRKTHQLAVMNLIFPSCSLDILYCDMSRIKIYDCK